MMPWMFLRRRSTVRYVQLQSVVRSFMSDYCHKPNRPTSLEDVVWSECIRSSIAVRKLTNAIDEPEQKVGFVL